MYTPFKTNPHKANSKISINNTLIAVCLGVFSIMWALSPERLIPSVLLQFIFAIPLLYISSISYTKIAYHDKVRPWDYLGWFTGTTGTAFVLNIFGVLTYSLGHETMALGYFVFTWLLLLIYTLTNIFEDKKSYKQRIFKFVYFIVIQLIFGVAILYL